MVHSPAPATLELGDRFEVFPVDSTERLKLPRVLGPAGFPIERIEDPTGKLLEVELDLAEDMIFKGLLVQCIVGRRLYETWHTMKSLLDSGTLNVAPAITHELAFEDFDHGMALMRDGLCGKVVFRM